jgi:hypothetical protein
MPSLSVAGGSEQLLIVKVMTVHTMVSILADHDDDQHHHSYHHKKITALMIT